MSRAKSGLVSKRRREKILKLAKGYRGRAKNCRRVAVEKVMKALSYAYRDRRQRKRQMKSIWIMRINAGARECGIKYSDLVCYLRKMAITINRKILADLAVNNFSVFSNLANQAKLSIGT